MPQEPKRSEKEPLKVTDKRIFTAEGEIKEEYRRTVTPADPVPAAKPAPESPPAAEPPDGKSKSGSEPAEPPNTPFVTFVESLIVNAYMSLGMLRNPYQPQPTVDLAAARQMIEILSMLQQKTKGNLTPDEEEFLTAHLSELKLKFVQKSKAL